MRYRCSISEESASRASYSSVFPTPPILRFRCSSCWPGRLPSLVGSTTKRNLAGRPASISSIAMTKSTSSIVGTRPTRSAGWSRISIRYILWLEGENHVPCATFEKIGAQLHRRYSSNDYSAADQSGPVGLMESDRSLSAQLQDSLWCSQIHLLAPYNARSATSWVSFDYDGKQYPLLLSLPFRRHFDATSG